MRVVLYCRQSESRGAGEQSLSIESQQAELERRAAKEGWRVIETLREADLKGWQDEDDRPEIERALKLAADGRFDILLVWKLDRLARSVRLQEYWVWRFAKAGIEIVSHTEPHVRQSALVRQILGAVAEQQTRDISAHVRRALTERAQRGQHNGGIVPYGYVCPDPDGPYIPGSPEVVAAIRELFRMAADGRGVVAIAERLTRLGVPTPRGLRDWRPQSIERIRANPVYKGERRWGSVTIAEAHEAIVDAATWQAAQSPGRAPKRKAAASWLESRIRHECGARMYLSVQKGRKAQFVCPMVTNLPARPRSCFVSAATVAQTRTEEMAWAAIVTGLSAVLDADAVAADARKLWKAEAPHAKGERKAIERKLAELRARRGRAEEAYLSGIKSIEWFSIEEKRIGDLVAAAEANLAALPAPPDLDALRSIERSLQSLAAMAEEVATDPEAQRMLLREIGHIVVAPGGWRCQGGGDTGRVRIVPAPEYAALWPRDKN